MLTKLQKRAILDYLLRSLYSTGMSSQSIGHLLRAFHFCIPFICMYLLIFGSYNLAIIGVIIILISIIAFILFKGCFMTKLETILLRDKFTVVDPMIEIIGFDVSYQSRYYTTITIGSTFCVLFCLVFMMKFVWNREILTL